jgi:hypothetical protein
MAQIIMGLNGLPAHLTVSAKNFRADADKKQKRGRLDLRVHCGPVRARHAGMRRAFTPRNARSSCTTVRKMTKRIKK